MHLPPRPVATLAVLASLLAAGPGCSILGVAAYKLSGPAKHAPAHALAAEPTIVVVDRETNFGAVALDAQRIAQRLTERLKAELKGDEKTPVPAWIDPGLAAELRGRRGPDGRRLRPSELAAACGAKQVIYIDLARYESSSSLGGDAADGRAEAVVRVVDAATGDVRWPPEASQGHSVAATVPFTPVTGGANEQTVRDQVSTDLAAKIARLFTGWTEE